MLTRFPFIKVHSKASQWTARIQSTGNKNSLDKGPRGEFKFRRRIEVQVFIFYKIKDYVLYFHCFYPSILGTF